MTSINPIVFFNSDKTIKEERARLEKFRIREEAAKGIDSKILLTEQEIEQIKNASRIVNGAVHPDTNEIIPFY